MAFLCSSSTDTATTTGTTTTQIPQWYEQALQRLVAAGESEVGAQPYQYYDPASRVAPLSPTEEAAISQVPMAAGAYMPGLRSAYNAATLGTRSLAQPRPIMDFMGPREGDVTPAGLGDVSSMGADLGAYMNPYTQYVTDVAKREAIRDYGKMRPQMGFNASRQGAFGGARYGVEEAEAQRNLGQRLSDIETKGLESAFTAGTGLFEKEAGRQLQAAPMFANIGAQAQGLGLGGLDAIMKSQAIPRGLEDKIRELTYGETMRGQGYGMNQLAGLSGIIRGVSPGGTTTSQQQQLIPQQSPLANLAGVGLTGAALYKLNPFNIFGG